MAEEAGESSAAGMEGLDSEARVTEQFMNVVQKVGQEAAAEKEVKEYADKAWVFLPSNTFPRRQCIAIVSHPIFDPIILMLIAANCVTMLVFNEPVLRQMISFYPDDFFERSEWANENHNKATFRPMAGCAITGAGPCSISQWIDFVFLLIFTVEMVLKLVAKGLIMHQNAYLRSTWNWLDFLVVNTGLIVTFNPGLPAVSTLRLIKTLRPLRTLQRIRGMRVLVQCILEALPQMCNVLLFLFFIMFFFGLIGTALFKGGLRYTCHTLADDGVTWESTDDICRPHCKWEQPDFITLSSSAEFTIDGVKTTFPTGCASFGPNTLGRENYDPINTWDWTYTCRPGEQCLCSSTGTADADCSIFANPNHGITSFDSLPWAIVSLFQAISLEGWVDMMYQLQDGVSSWVWTYFVLLVLFGAIIVINLFLAVLCDNFEMADDQADAEAKNNGIDEEEQKAAAALKAELKHLEYKGNPARQAVLNLIQHNYFDWFVQSCIILNTLIMTLRWAPQPEYARWQSIPVEWVSSDYMPPNLADFMFIMNIVLTAIFTLESILKVIGLGPKLFVVDRMNDFDAVVVAISIFEIVIDVIGKQTGNSVYFPLPLSVLRAFRIFRLFKLVKSVPSMRKILFTLAQSIGSVVYLAMLLGLMILIFTLLGMELFGGYYPRPELNYTSDKFPDIFSEAAKDRQIIWEGDVSRYHFDDPGNACLSIFVVLSGENWNEIMFDAHTSTYISPVYVPAGIIYFMVLFIVGNLLLFNLFIAILLSNFDDDEEEEEEEEEDVLEDASKGAIDRTSNMSVASKPPEAMMEWKFNGYMQTIAAGLGAGGEKGTSTRKSNSSGNGAEPPLPEEDDGESEKPQELFPKTAADSNGDRSMMIFSWQNPIRIMMARLVTHPWFEAVIVAMILISTALMLLDMPHYRADHPLRRAISIVNTVFAIIFTFEMIFKWIATGVVFSKTPKEYKLADSYFLAWIKKGPNAGKKTLDFWNILDFVIVVISLVSIADIDAVKPLKAFRAFRPLRLVSRYEDLKITVATLFQSVPAMGSLCSVASLFFLIFAILGVELYGGKLGYCMDPDYEDLPYGSRVLPGMNGTQTDYEECMSLPRYNLTRKTTSGIDFRDMADMFPNDPRGDWLDFIEFPQWFYPSFGYFDNLKLSLFLLFEISALEGWPDVMHWCMDSDSEELFVVPWRVGSDVDRPAGMTYGLGGVGEEMQEHTPQSGITAIFFIAWIIVGCFVVVNMTVGVVVDTFSQIKAENDGLLLMTEDAADWVKAQKQVFAMRPLVQAAPPQGSQLRLNMYYFVTSTKFELFIMAVILGNMLQMGIDFWEPAANLPEIVAVKQAMNVCNYIFLGIYVVEMICKWIGLGVVNYFKNRADVFDFILVMISLFEVVIGNLDSEAGIEIGFVRVLRLFRVMRILRVIKSAKSLRTIIMTVYISIPQLKNISVLVMLVIIIADVLCVNIFSFVNYTPGNHDSTYEHITSQARGEVLPDPDAYYFSGSTNWGDMINRHANFQYWFTGMLVLIRSATGESFNGIMHDLFDWQWGDNRLKCCFECGPILDGQPQTYSIVRGADGMIVPGATLTIPHVPENSCGSTGWALFIYFSFQVIMAYVVLSIMIGVILENFANVGSETRKIRIDDLEDFREVWLKYDPKGTFIVPSHNLLAILQQLKDPLGIAGRNPALTRGEMLKHLGMLDIPDHGGYIHFMETLTAVANFHCGVPVPVCDTTKKLAKSAQQVPKLKVLDKPAHNALTNYLVSLLQSRWRGYAMRKRYDGDDAGAEGGPPPAAFAQPKVKPSQVAPEPAPPGAS